MIQTRTVQTDNDRAIIEKSVSEYALDQPATKAEIVVIAEKIKGLFDINDTLLDYMCAIFSEAFWPLRKIEDAIKYVIKTHKYKQVKPADILSYDRRIPFYSYHEMIELGGWGFCCVIIPGLPNMVRKSDSIKPEYVDGGWYVRYDQNIPELWQPWGTTKQAR